MKTVGLILMIPLIFNIFITAVSFFLISQLKKRSIFPEQFEGKGTYDKGYSLGQHLKSLTFLFIILFIIGLLLNRGWIF